MGNALELGAHLESGSTLSLKSQLAALVDRIERLESDFEGVTATLAKRSAHTLSFQSDTQQSEEIPIRYLISCVWTDGDSSTRVGRS